MKNYNQSKIDAITIQKNKLVEAGDIFLDDYCKDAINSEYKQRCEIYYQKLDKDAFNEEITEYLVDGKEYKINISEILIPHFLSRSLGLLT